MKQIESLIREQTERLVFYSPYNFLRPLGTEKQVNYIHNKLQPFISGDETYFIFNGGTEEEPYFFLYQFLNWDSNYFKVPTYKLFTVIGTDQSFTSLGQAVEAFKLHLQDKKASYCFIDIPAEDIRLIQALSTHGFRLTETRLTYYYDQVADFNYPRFPVRAATQADIPALKKVASEARNDYDRYHADIAFSEAQADAYLGTYAEACVNGLCESVLVPDEPGVPAEAFLAISQLKGDATLLGTGFARVVLTAVGPACKGWHVKLVAETVQFAKDQNCKYVLMTTQATNRAVFRTSEKLGFKLGNTTHLLALNL